MESQLGGFSFKEGLEKINDTDTSSFTLPAVNPAFSVLPFNFHSISAKWECWPPFIVGKTEAGEKLVESHC